MKLSIIIEQDPKTGLYNLHCVDENNEVLCKDAGRPIAGIADDIREILTVKEAQNSLAQLTEELRKNSYTTIYRFPLAGCLQEYGVEDSQSPSELVGYAIDIQDAMDVRQDDMVQYFDESARVKDILLSAVWGTMVYDRELYGTVTVQTTEKLSERDVETLRHWIIGQNADGLGEGFEQMPIDIRPGVELFVSFGWDDNDVVPVCVNTKDGE